MSDDPIAACLSMRMSGGSLGSQIPSEICIKNNLPLFAARQHVINGKVTTVDLKKTKGRPSFLKSSRSSLKNPIVYIPDPNLSDDPIGQAVSIRLKNGGLSGIVASEVCKKNNYPVFSAQKHKLKRN